MRHLSNIIALSLLFGGNAMMAQEVSIDVAKSRALDFLSRQSIGPKFAKGTTSSTDLKLAYTSKSEAKTCFYVFNVGDDEGFVIAGGDEAALEILGFSDHGTFDYDAIPPAFKWWLSLYTEQISLAASSGAVRSTKTTVERENIEPLIKTKWRQDSPYYNMMPCSSDNPYSHYLTGCVATSMAQVMNYHKYPERGIGELTYSNVDGTKTYSANFGATTYDWDNMLEDYDGGATQEQIDAVATLMYHAAVSVYMMYSMNGSSAYSSDIGSALARYFGYDKSIRYENREYFSDEEWEELVYNELKEKRPVLYSGSEGYGSSHSYICDGYRDGGFHFNWGWGDNNDAYFLLTATSDDDTHKMPYSSYPDIVRNVFPDNGGSATGHLALHSFSANPLYLKVGDTVCDDNYDFDRSSNEETSFSLFASFISLACVCGNKTYFGESSIPYEFGVKATDKATGLTHFWQCKGTSKMTNYYQRCSDVVQKFLEFNPNDLEFNGTYILEPTYRIVGQKNEDWQVIDILNTETRPTITVSGAEDPRPNRLAFSIDSTSIHENSSVRIHWPDDYNGVISFTSDDETIATVDENGTIRSVAEGRVDITACAPTTSTYCGCTQTFTIIVIGIPKYIYFVERPYFNNDNNPYPRDMELHYKITNTTGEYQTFNLYGDIEGTDIMNNYYYAIDDGDVYEDSFFFPYYDLIPDTEYKVTLYREILEEEHPEAPARQKAATAEDDDDYSEDEPVYIPMNYPSVTFTFRSELTVNYQVSPAGWSTLILPFNAELPNGMKIYTCSELNGNVLILKTDNRIRRNVPYIVSAAPNATCKFVGPKAIDADKPSFQEGLLVGAVTDNVPLQKGTDYIMQCRDDEAAFYKYTGIESDEPSENDANGNRLARQFRAFLRLPNESSSQAPKINFPGNGDDETEGISTLTTDALPAGIYTLDGHRQSTFQKGLNILILDDGTAQKVFVK